MLLFLGMAFGLFMVASLIGLPVLANIAGIPATEFADSSRWDLNNPKMITVIRGFILLQFLFLFAIPSLLFAHTGKQGNEEKILGQFERR